MNKQNLRTNSLYYKFYDRQTNMEYLRIFAMFLIVLSHISIYLEYPTLCCLDLSFQDYIMKLFGGFGRIGTNSFVLLTGYFSVKSCFKVSSLFKLWSITAFYSILFFVIFKLGLHEKFDIRELLSYMFPISFEKYWFVSCYFCLYLFSPFLIKGINNMTQKQHLALILIIYLSLWPTLMIYPEYAKGVNYNLYQWFIVMFLIGSYFRLYVSAQQIKIYNCFLIIMLSLTLYLFYIISIDQIMTDWHLYFDRNNFFLVVISISLFAIFIKIKSTPNKYVNTISVCMIGVYLAHIHPVEITFIKQYIPISVSDKYLVPEVILSAVIVFLASLAIEYLRRSLSKPFSKIVLKKLMIYDEKIRYIIQEKPQNSD